MARRLVGPLPRPRAASSLPEAGYRLGNLDVTIICEAPKIGPHRDAMRAKLAEIAGVDASMRVT